MDNVTTKNTQVPLKKRLPPLRIPLAAKTAEILDGIIYRRAMTVAQLQALYKPCRYTPDDIGMPAYLRHRKSQYEATRQVVDKLFWHGFLKRVQLPMDRFGRRPWLYGNTSWKGVQQVAGFHHRRLNKIYGDAIPLVESWKTQAHTLAEKYQWRSTDKALSMEPSNLKHFLKEIDVNVILTLACQNHSFIMPHWDSDLALRRRHSKVKVEYISPATGERETTQVIPDGRYVIEDPTTGRTEMFFAEIDLATATQTPKTTKSQSKKKKSWTHRFTAQMSFLHHHFEELYPECENPKVIVITTSSTRMQHLKHVCHASEGDFRSQFYFTFFDLYLPQNVLTKPIYQVANDTSGKWVSLLGDDEGKAMAKRE